MLNIDSIQNGIVIDHIQAGKGMRIYELLELDKLDCCVALIKNARAAASWAEKISSRLKATSPSTSMCSALSITTSPYAPLKTVSLWKKENIVLPRRIKNVVKCKNPRCITSAEESLDQIFVLCDEKAHRYRCLYCEQAYKSHE